MRRTSVFSVALAWVMLAGASATATDVNQDLRSGGPDPKILRVIGVGPGCRATPSAEGLRLTIAGDRPAGPVGLELASWVRGDFELTASYQIHQIGPPTSGYGAGVGLTLELDAAGDPTVTIERQAAPGEVERFVSTLIDDDDSGNRRYRPETAPTHGLTGRLQIRRTGAQIETAVSEANEPFRPIRSLKLSSDPVKAARLTAFTGTAACVIDVMITDVQIHAEALTPPQIRQARSSPRSVFWARLTLALLINLMVLAGLALWRWPGLLGRGWIDRVGGSTPLVLVLVAVVALASHVRGLNVVGVHEDERIWVERAYFYRLAVLDHDLDHRLWNDFDGIDAPHLGEFLSGLGLHVAGYPLPAVPDQAAPWTNAPDPAGGRLRAARLPSALLGSLIAPLVAWIAIQTTGRFWAGLVAGLIYAVHPLAVRCESQVMSEAGYQLFSIAVIALATWACRPVNEPRGMWCLDRRGLTLLVLGPVCVGLATAGKLTGIIGCAVVLATLAVTTLADVLRGGPGRWARLRMAGVYALVFGITTASLVVLFNPTLYADPWSRFRAMTEHRLRTVADQVLRHPQWALHSPTDYFHALLSNVATIHGFGAIGIPLTVVALAGLALLAEEELRRLRRGLNSGPGLVVLIWSVLLLGGLLPSLPLNWDRYFLPFVPPWAVGLGAGGAALGDWLWRRCRRAVLSGWVAEGSADGVADATADQGVGALSRE